MKITAEQKKLIRDITGTYFEAERNLKTGDLATVVEHKAPWGIGHVWPYEPGDDERPVWSRTVIITKDIKKGELVGSWNSKPRGKSEPWEGEV